MSENSSLADILQLSSLETHALLQETHTLLESRNIRRKLFASYLAMREKIGEDFMPLVSQREPFMNDHSRRHLERVLHNVESILQHCFPKPSSPIHEIPAGRVITWVDTLIILNAIVWHDIGNIYGRKEHGIRVMECFEHLSGANLYDEHLRRYIVQVAKAHSGINSIENTIPDSVAVLSYKSVDIHLQFDAAVLRFADELDEDHRRAEPYEWDRMGLIPRKSQRFWYFCKVNSSVKVSCARGDHSTDFWINIVSHIPESEFDREFFKDDNRNVRALTEYLRRILKIDAERKYCNTYLRSAYYHPGIRGLRVCIMYHDKSAPPSDAKMAKFELSDSISIDMLLHDPSLQFMSAYLAEATA